MKISSFYVERSTKHLIILVLTNRYFPLLQRVEKYLQFFSALMTHYVVDMLGTHIQYIYNIFSESMKSLYTHIHICTVLHLSINMSITLFFLYA
jgi:hypothetical protein